MSATEQLSLMKNETPEITPMGMLQIAVSQGADLEKLSKLMELHERWEDREARKAFERDFALFKSEAVPIVRNIAVTDGPLKGKKYADLFGVVSAITPALSKNHLSHSWKITKDEPAWIEVTCTVRHDLGHSESVSMGGPPDTGGAKNAIQARASSISYLERYTLLAATGMAAQGQDEDGKGAGSGSRMDEAAVVEQIDFIKGARTTSELQTFFARAYKLAEAAKDRQAATDFIKARDERKAALNASR